MADDGDGLARVEEGLHELDGLWLHPERVGIHDAAGKQQRVELLDVRPAQRDIDREVFTPLGEVPATDALGLRRHDAGVGASEVEGLLGLGELDLLETVTYAARTLAHAEHDNEYH